MIIIITMIVAIIIVMQIIIMIVAIIIVMQLIVMIMITLTTCAH